MKKVSTVGTEQGRNICQQRLTIGLDLGDRNSWYGHRPSENKAVFRSSDVVDSARSIVPICECLPDKT